MYFYILVQSTIVLNKQWNSQKRLFWNQLLPWLKQRNSEYDIRKISFLRNIFIFLLGLYKLHWLQSEPSSLMTNKQTELPLLVKVCLKAKSLLEYCSIFRLFSEANATQAHRKYVTLATFLQNLKYVASGTFICTFQVAIFNSPVSWKKTKIKKYTREFIFCKMLLFL